MRGDFEPKKIIEEVKKRLVKKPKQGKIQRIEVEEKEEIVRKKAEATMEVSMPIFVIGIKDKVEKKNIIAKHVAIEIILNMLIGKSSELYKELYDQELLMSEPYTEYEFTKTYAHIAITGQSKNPELILTKLLEKIEEMKKNGINEEHFNRIKNMLYGSYIKEFNNVSNIARMFVTDYFKDINSFDYINKYANIKKEYVADILNKVFKEEKTLISIVKGK